MKRRRCIICGKEVTSDNVEFCSNPDCHGAYMPLVDEPLTYHPALEEDHCWNCGHLIYKTDEFKCDKCLVWHCPNCGKCFCELKKFP